MGDDDQVIQDILVAITDILKIQEIMFTRVGDLENQVAALSNIITTQQKSIKLLQDKNVI